MAKTKTPKKTSRKSVTKKKVTKKTTRNVATKINYINKNGTLKKSTPIGSFFKARIDGKLTEGRIWKEKKDNGLSWYLLQNQEDGTCPDSGQTLRYKYSWQFDCDNPQDEDVEFISVEADPNFKVPPPTSIPPRLGSYRPIIKKGYIMVGCQTIPNKVVREMVKFLQD